METIMLPKFNHTKKDGFTLIETIISLAVLGMFFASVVLILQMIVNLIGDARVRTIATSLAQERVDFIRNLPYNDIGTIGGIPPGTLLQDETVSINNLEFTITTSVVYVDDPFDGVLPDDLLSTDYKRARVSISWGGVFASKNPLVFVTNASPKGLETTLGGGTLSILVFNALGEPVDSASVHIENVEVNPTIDLNLTTNTQGIVLLPGAPACNECYKVTVTKDGHSTHRTYATSEVTNPLKPYITVLEGSLSETSFSIDQLSSIAATTTQSRSSGYLPFSGVQFTLQSSKIIGTDNDDNPVYKYEVTHTSGQGGQITIPDLEWDMYSVLLPTASSVDISGTNPITPFSLLPNSTVGLTIVTAGATNDSLLTIVTDADEIPLASASVEISSNTYTATGSTGLAGVGDFGQVFFPGLDVDIYAIRVTLPSYEEATASVTVSGDVSETVILAPEE